MIFAFSRWTEEQPDWTYRATGSRPHKRVGFTIQKMFFFPKYKLRKDGLTDEDECRNYSQCLQWLKDYSFK